MSNKNIQEQFYAKDSLLVWDTQPQQFAALPYKKRLWGLLCKVRSSWRDASGLLAGEKPIAWKPGRELQTVEKYIQNGKSKVMFSCLHTVRQQEVKKKKIIRSPYYLQNMNEQQMGTWINLWVTN